MRWNLAEIKMLTQRTDEEAAASKRMEVLSTSSRNNKYPLFYGRTRL